MYNLDPNQDQDDVPRESQAELKTRYSDINRAIIGTKGFISRCKKGLDLMGICMSNVRSSLGGAANGIGLIKGKIDHDFNGCTQEIKSFLKFDELQNQVDNLNS